MVRTPNRTGIGMRITEITKVFKRPLTLGLFVLMGLSVSRLVLVWLFWSRVGPTEGLAFILLEGIRFDIMLVGLVIGPVFLLKPLFHTWTPLIALDRWLGPLYLGLVASFVFFVESATYSFINEYDHRPNYTFVEYLQYPKELLATLAGSHLLELLIFSALTLLIFILVFKWARSDSTGQQRLPLSTCLLAFPFIAIVVVLMTRSTLDHRPVNPSIAAFSQDSMVNQLALNSPYSLLYAIYEQHRDNTQGDVRYGAMGEQEVLDRIIDEAGITPGALVEGAGPTMHHQFASSEPDRPQNLVIILEESLGAEFVGSLGGKNLTPWLDKASNDGIWMEQLYATGTRSARGIEAVITGFTPTNRRSVVKLRETQENFFTLASLLEQQGYQTSFVYGGEAHFDNMKRFFLNNGFQTVIDEKDYVDPVFMAAWGVSDEDLFDRAHEMFEQAGPQPFFSLVFTSSNHEPFDIPSGRVEPEAGPDGARETAVKYADYALGRYLEMARHSKYWDNTVFLVIADHNSRVFGDILVPVERFHIPGLIFGGQIEPHKVPGISSQIDMVPTLLSLMGVDADHPGIGRDLTRPEFLQGAGRAIMQYSQLAAYLVPGKVVIMRPDLPLATYRYASGQKLEPLANRDVELEKTALAYELFGSIMIQNHWYSNPLVTARDKGRSAGAGPDRNLN